MATERERAILRAVDAAPPGADVLVIDGRTGRAGAARGAWDDNDGKAACIVVAGPIDLRRLGIDHPSIRPGRMDACASGAESGDLAMLVSEDRRRVKRWRNRAAHANAAREATSAPVAPSEGDARPSASAEAEEAPTRPEVRVI